MSSRTLATATRGLPDVTPPPPSIDVHRFGDAAWPDAPGPDDASASNHENEFTGPKPEKPQSPSRPSRPSWSEADIKQRNRAVGNLLAALAPISPPLNSLARPGAAPSQTLPHAAVDTDDANRPVASPVGSDMTPEPFPEDEQLPQPPPTAPEPAPAIPPLPSLSSPDDLMDAHMHSSSFPHTDPVPSIEQTQTFPPESNGLGMTPSFIHPGQQVPEPTQDSTAERREVEAFAKIEFEDGNYYITTYACELGRDAFAYRAALNRAEEARQAEQEGKPHSSSGRRSGMSDGHPRAADSQVQGSVVSEAGGFGGVDDPLPQERDVEGHPLHSHSSERSAGSVVKPQEVLINPPLIPFDYKGMAERQAQLERGIDLDLLDNEQPAPVTADHIPDANNCPLIPIHAMRTAQQSEVENHRSISRRHVKIQWDFEKECFQMKVLGRNGAFLNDQYLPRGGVKRLHDGAKIQISNVDMTFRLPNRKSEPPSDDSEHDERGHTPEAQRSTSPTSNDNEADLDGRASPSRSGKTRTKIVLTTSQKPHSTVPETPDPLVGPDGQPMPPRKRGPGRPPKDGIMSTRERREREKAMKLAEAKAANGGRTPPPMMKGKFPKPPVKEDSFKQPEPKIEKRKYKKRKRSGEDGDVVQSIEGGEMEITSEPEKPPPPPKKARQSKSPSPEYPPAESLTEEQLARPSEPYARLIYDILIEIHPKALPLKQIYRALKLKFPFFVHRVDSEGWQSSVRHNLNQEWNKLFEKGEKEGKGFAWKAIPGALQPQAERRRAAQQAAANKPKPQPTPRQHPHQGPTPPLNWQNSTPYPPQNGMRPPPPFFVQGPNGPMPPPNGMPWPPGSYPPNGPPHAGAPQPPPGQNGQFPPPPAPGARPPLPPQQQPARPTPGQQPAPGQGPTRPPSSTAPPIPPPTVSTSSSASRNMPCTTDGLLAIRRFETAMYDQVGDPAKIEQWQRVFSSVKRRLLHGAPQSQLPEGETKEEVTIMEHVRRFIDRFKNPNFEGFTGDQVRGTASPAPPAPSAPSAPSMAAAPPPNPVTATLPTTTASVPPTPTAAPQTPTAAAPVAAPIAAAIPPPAVVPKAGAPAEQQSASDGITSNGQPATNTPQPPVATGLANEPSKQGSLGDGAVVTKPDTPVQEPKDSNAV